MKRRRLGLQGKWSHVVNSLQEIISSYELASSRISLFSDRRLRSEAVGFAVGEGSLVLDLGAGPGTMSRLVRGRAGEPVLVDVSRPMLKASSFENRVQAVFERLPFRDGSFDCAVSGFALRDAQDLLAALTQVKAVLKAAGKFAFCDLGKPDSGLGTAVMGCYLRVVPNVVGLVMAGRSGLKYGSIFDTYVLTLHNSQMASLLSLYFREVTVHETQMGGSVVMKCTK